MERRRGKLGTIGDYLLGKCASGDSYERKKTLKGLEKIAGEILQEGQEQISPAFSSQKKAEVVILRKKTGTEKVITRPLPGNKTNCLTLIEEIITSIKEITKGANKEFSALMVKDRLGPNNKITEMEISDALAKIFICFQYGSQMILMTRRRIRKVSHLYKVEKDFDKFSASEIYFAFLNGHKRWLTNGQKKLWPETNLEIAAELIFRMAKEKNTSIFSAKDLEKMLEGKAWPATPSFSGQSSQFLRKLADFELLERNGKERQRKLFQVGKALLLALEKGIIGDFSDLLKIKKKDIELPKEKTESPLPLPKPEMVNTPSPKTEKGEKIIKISMTIDLEKNTIFIDKNGESMTFANSSIEILPDGRISVHPLE